MLTEFRRDCQGGHPHGGKMDDRLSERKKKVLNALVDSYISDAEPISSSAIKSKYMPDVSSATIRSELATLEELG